MIKRLVETIAECDWGCDMIIWVLFHTYKGFYHRFHIIAEMAENQKLKGPLWGVIQSIAEETESDYLLVSDAYHEAELDKGADYVLKVDDRKKAQILRRWADKLSLLADEAERKCNDGLTDKELEDRCRDEEQRYFLHGLTLQETVDELAGKLNNGYTYTQIMEMLKQLLEVKHNLSEVDDDRIYDEVFGLTYSECLISELRDAGVDVERLEAYL